MFIFHPLDVLCLAGGVAAKTPDRLTLDLQRPWDRNAMGLFGFAELMKVRSAPFHTPIQLRDGRGIAATDDQVILGHAQGRQIPMEFHIEQMRVVFRPRIVPVGRTAAAPEAVCVRAVGDLTHEYSTLPFAICVEHAVIK